MKKVQVIVIMNENIQPGIQEFMMSKMEVYMILSNIVVN